MRRLALLYSFIIPLADHITKVEVKVAPTSLIGEHYYAVSACGQREVA